MNVNRVGWGFLFNQESAVDQNCVDLCWEVMGNGDVVDGEGSMW